MDFVYGFIYFCLRNFSVDILYVKPDILGCNATIYILVKMLNIKLLNTFSNVVEF
jgi:hypothetical protein